MGQSLTDLLYHITFSTEGRAPLIADGIRARFHGYLVSLIAELKGQVVAVYAAPDHVHLLVRLPAAVSVSQALRVVKANSSRWAAEIVKGFAWQGGYAAFTVGHETVETARQYVENQALHHARTDYREELLRLFAEHGVDYDDQYLWS